VLAAKGKTHDETVVIREGFQLGNHNETVVVIREGIIYNHNKTVVRAGR
jgi:hypothetical protein